MGVGELGTPADRPSTLLWLGCGLSIGAAILLRPDGGILLAAIGGYLLWLLARSLATRRAAAPTRAFATPRTIFWAGVLVAVGATAPSIPWTLRNLHTLHRFEPLAPRYANDSDELVMNGFNRWVKTWTADYVSVQEIYWNVPGEEIDVTRLPRRAFDSPQQREQTRELFADYNHDHDMTPELDARFASLAAERVHASPLRYYVWLPVIRIADMWLRPRTELSSADPRWWEFNDDRRLACAQPRLRPLESALRRARRSRTRAQPRIFWPWPIRFISAAALRISRKPGKSRTPLHTRMLSRGHSPCFGALSSQ